AVRRRIHNDGIISIAAPLFTLGEFEYIICYEAYGSVFQTRKLDVLFGPLYHSFRCIYMTDFCSCSSSRNRCSTRIGKQVKDLDRSTAARDLVHDPRPIDGLFREEPRMFKVCRMYR